MKLIALYFYICECYDTTLQWHCQKFSNFSSSSHLTDQEILTIYLFAIYDEDKTKVKSIHEHAKKYWLSWFPNLPSYQAFNARINRLATVLPSLVQCILDDTPNIKYAQNISVLDSMPIVTCSGKRRGKVAPNLTDKGYCSTKSMHYFGVKLHGIGFHRSGMLPYPEFLKITPASSNDLQALREQLVLIYNRIFFADKAYCDADLDRRLSENNSEILTPVKLKKGQSKIVRQFNKAADELYSTAVSKVRQPIEGFFAWLQRKTDIQKASLVRSAKGLIVHIYGKICATLLNWFFKQ